METIRQKMIEMLSNGPATAIGISQELGIREKEVYDHLSHIARSMRAKARRLDVRPAVCLKCGFVFKARRKFTRPGRCPRCRETHIQSPSYEVL